MRLVAPQWKAALPQEQGASNVLESFVGVGARETRQRCASARAPAAMKERGLWADAFALAKAIAEARKTTPPAATSSRTVFVKEAVETETRADENRDENGATRLRFGGVKVAAERQAGSSGCAGPA